jgi:hypothetical protein
VPYGVAIDSAYMYVVGNTNANVPDWKIEKRTLYNGEYVLGPDVGGTLAALNTSITAPAQGTIFRLRMTLHPAGNDILPAAVQFKLQFAGKGAGTCAAPSGTPSYTDITTSTAIAFADNSVASDGNSFQRNANDPTHSTDTIIKQTYEEANNFTTSARIGIAQDGLWDFALKDNTASGSTTYCIRAVKSDNSALDVYSFYPELTTAAGAGGSPPTTDQRMYQGKWFNNDTKQDFFLD